MSARLRVLARIGRSGVVLVVLGVIGLAGQLHGLSTAAAEESEARSLEQLCIAAGTALPQEFHAFTFNHHPQAKREIKITDHYLAAAEIVTELEGVIPQLPESCRGHFRRTGLVKAQFKASRGGAKWRSVPTNWERLSWQPRYISGTRYPHPVSPFMSFRSEQNVGSLGLGCAVAGRVKFKLEIVDEDNEAIVAIRSAEYPSQVDSWFQARCQGKFSLHSAATAKRCGGRVIGARAGGTLALWGVKADRVSCSRASALAQEALQVPAFSQGSLLEQPVDEWQCFYGHRGAASCLKGSRHIYLGALGKASADECQAAPRGVALLRVARSSCDVAIELATLVQQDPRTDSLVSHQGGGRTWSCPSYRHLGEDDLMTDGYHCFSSDATIAFEVADSKARLVPVTPTSIPPDVVFPAAGTIGFPRNPKLTFGETVLRGHKILLPLQAEEALVGRDARIKINPSTMECNWTADPSQTEPICGHQKRVGKSIIRHLTLKSKQFVYIAPRHHHGNWAYPITATTQRFTYNGLSYKKTVAPGWAGIINDAGNCAASPWCHHARAVRRLAPVADDRPLRRSASAAN